LNSLISSSQYFRAERDTDLRIVELIRDQAGKAETFSTARSVSGMNCIKPRAAAAD
jgi:hypothetical protein